MARVNELQVNGKAVRIDADEARTLLSVLRDDLDLTGAKYGCGEGECGACTVLIDGAPRRSCRLTLSEIAGRRITTVESLERDGKLHPVQEAFLKEDALQCGYCTCGMIMTAYALLQRSANPTENQIVRAMNGNVCRCGTYQRIVAAVKRAAQEVKGGAQ
jgi:aerobic-type carbon monoxide dehydrogenase small subunit (CoxS/CutS family)